MHALSSEQSCAEKHAVHASQHEPTVQVLHASVVVATGMPPHDGALASGTPASPASPASNASVTVIVMHAAEHDMLQQASIAAFSGAPTGWRAMQSSRHVGPASNPGSGCDGMRTGP